jgi:HAD superfamily hydrolase (TIGR01509 family)
MPGAFTRQLPVRALIFDMDGVLADTEPLHVQSWVVTLEGIDPAILYGERGHMVGMSSRVIAGELIRRLDLNTTVAELVERKRTAYRAIADHALVAFRGLEDEISLLKDRGVPLSLATSSARPDVDFALERIGFHGVFSPIVTSDDVRASKPAPDCYLLAAELLGLPASECLVIEDSANGIHAAVQAGTRVLAVSPLPPEELPRGVLRVFPTTVEALQWLRA